MTTGALAVDVASSAYRGISGGSSTASLYFDAGVAQPAAGHASVNGNVKALGSNGYLTGDSRATLTLYRTGTLTGTSLAQAADSYNDPYIGSGTAGAADSKVIGVTSGRHDVSLTSAAQSGNAPFFGAGAANATVSGQSGSGKVLVLANANSNLTPHQDSRATAQATARAADWGGVTEARANAVGDIASARAEAYSAGGDAIAVASGTGLSGSVVASSNSTTGGRALSASASGELYNYTSFTATARAPLLNIFG